MENLLPKWPPYCLQRLRDELQGVLVPRTSPTEKIVLQELAARMGTADPECSHDYLLERMGKSSKNVKPSSSPVFTATSEVRKLLPEFEKLEPHIHLEIPWGRYGIICGERPQDEWMLKPTRLVGFLIANAADWFTGNTILGAIEVLRDSGFDLLPDISQDKPEGEENRLSEIVSKTEGLLIVPVGDRLLNASSVNLLHSKPCVLVDRYFPGIVDIPCVHHDDISAGRKAAEYLIEVRKCKRIIIVGQRSHLVDEQELTPLQDRKYGCRLAAGKESVAVIFETPRDADEAGGFETLRFIDKAHKLQRTDGIFALTDKVALGCRYYLARKGSKWLDLPLIGFEGQPFGDFLRTQLASNYADPIQLGRGGAEILLAQMRKRDLPRPKCYPHFLSPTSLFLPSKLNFQRTKTLIEYPDAEERYLGR